MRSEDDFRRTAETMMNDARTLRASGSHRNACYLAGYVVECVLKALIEVTRRRPENTHDLVSLRDHVAKLSLAAGQSVAKYGDPLLFAPTLTHQLDRPQFVKGRLRHYCDWDPYHRYDGSRWTQPVRSLAYIEEAEKALKIMNQMFLDGVFQ